jgi:hypothetical protein
MKKIIIIPAEQAKTNLTFVGKLLGNHTKSIAFSLRCNDDKPSIINTNF